RPARALLLLERRELLGSRQLAVPEEEGDLLERARRAELLHRIAAIEQRVGLGVDLRDRGGVGVDAREPLLDVDVGHDGSCLLVGGQERLVERSNVNTSASNAPYAA